jgi:hypothetical protein
MNISSTKAIWHPCAAIFDQIYFNRGMPAAVAREKVCKYGFEMLGTPADA